MTGDESVGRRRHRLADADEAHTDDHAKGQPGHRDDPTRTPRDMREPLIRNSDLLQRTVVVKHARCQNIPPNKRVIAVLLK